MMMNELEITQQDSDFSFDELERVVNSILLKKPGKGLTDLQVKILKGIFEGKIYRDIAEAINYHEQSIKNEASELFTLLNNSGKLEEEINKGNLVSLLKRYKKKHQNIDNNHDGAKKAEQHKVIVIDGKLNQLDQAKIEAIIKLLQKQGKDISMEIVDIEEGSIKITIKGTEEGLARLQELFDSGELNNLEGFEVLELRDLDETDKEKLNAQSLKKARLIEAIRGEKVNKKTELIEANLSEADLRGANLIWANLSEANLSEANLSEAYLSWVYLSGADLSGANLIRTNLIRADLSRANLSEANLSEANLSEANLSRAYLNWTDLSMANLSGADLSRANLSMANLSGANLSMADLSGANLSGANLSGADLSGANLSGADLSEADLSEAYLIRADLSGADLSGTQVEKAIFINNQGISEATKKDLISRGARFDDFPHDHSKVKSLV